MTNNCAISVFMGRFNLIEIKRSPSLLQQFWWQTKILKTGRGRIKFLFGPDFGHPSLSEAACHAHARVSLLILRFTFWSEHLLQTNLT